MTATPTTAPVTTRGIDTRLLLAAIAYSLSWIVGLTLLPADTNVRSSGRELLDAIAGRFTDLAAQYVVTEVLTGLALIVVTLTVTQLLRPAATTVAARARAAGVTAAVMSLAQGALGVTIALGPARDGNAQTTETLTRILSVVDGVKMLVLAAATLALAALIRAARAQQHPAAPPAWLAAVSALTGAALVVSGTGYLLLIPALAAAAYVSLPGLLLVVTGTGVVTAVRLRRAA